MRGKTIAVLILVAVALVIGHHEIGKFLEAAGHAIQTFGNFIDVGKTSIR